MREPVATNLIQNPQFLTGSSDFWALGSGWSIVFAGLPTGVGYSACFDAAGTGALVSETQIMCAPGGVVSASCSSLGEPSAAGLAALRVSFYDSNDAIIGTPNYSSYGVNNYVWATLSVAAAAPPSVSYAIVDYVVADGDGSGARWFVSNFTGVYLPGGMIDNVVTYKQPLSYYLNLFTSQYRLSTNLLAWQTALLQPIDYLTNTAETINIAYDLDNAFGDQLDVIGELIGQTRTVSFQPSGGVSPVLDDATYRLLLYATQAKNLWDGKTASLYPIWKFLFPGAVLIVNDNQNMTATILYSGMLSSIEQDLITNGLIVPRPEGVLYNYNGSGAAIFGFDLNTSTIAGFDAGIFA